MRATVVGAGSFGTVFAQLLADAGQEVTLWTPSEAVAQAVATTRRNSEYAHDIVLPPAVTATTDLPGALRDAEIVVIALPSHVLREALAPVSDAVPASAYVLSLVKGVELSTDKRASEVLAEVWGLGPERLAVLSGPNLSVEIGRREPTTTVVACADEDAALAIAEAVSTPYFRVFTTTDVIGAEFGGSVKNVIALAVGMAKGMGYGDNTLASIMTRGLSEATRIGVALGARPETFAGLAGMGDLIATCSSPLSRNHRLGSFLGKGMDLTSAIAATGSTAEGAKSCRPVLELAERYGVKASIIRAVVNVVYDGVPATDVVARLVHRPPRKED